MRKLFRIILLTFLVIVLLIAALFITFEYTNLPFAEMYRQDKCLDNGGEWNKEKNLCLGGKYGIKEEI